MSLIKLYRGPILQSLLNEIVQPVIIKYAYPDRPTADLLTIFDDLSDMVPAIVIEMAQAISAEVERVTVSGKNGAELNFAGPPIGTEVAALVSAVVVAGRGDSGLAPETRHRLKGLNKPANLLVFSSPT